MKNTVSNINIINTILEALDRSEEDILSLIHISEPTRPY